MIVVDASILASALVDDGEDGHLARGYIVFEHLFAPEIIDLEVTSVIRRCLRSGSFKPHRADQAIKSLADLPLKRVAHRPLIPRIWELRNNLTPYDAAYVALAEAIKAPLVTSDKALTKAPGIRCEIKLLS
jgi:predicted nucleic acid-binding protein